MNKTKVSVCCITYNHEDYIKDCLKGFLAQKTTFDVEFLIHDDASTDGTQEIIRLLVGRDKRFNLTLRTKNIKSKGVSVFPLLYKKSCGTYIATCEGDDYWTDPYKLQKQVDLLENNSSCNYLLSSFMVYHKSGLFSKKEFDIKNTFNLNYAFRNSVGPSTLTVMFRRERFLQIMDLFPEKTFSSDWVIFVLMGSEGEIGYINDVTAVYREGVGIISNTSNIYKFLNGLETNKHLNKVTGFKYDYHLGNYLFHYSNITYSYLEQKKRVKGLFWFFKTLIYFLKQKKSDKSKQKQSVFLKHSVKLFFNSYKITF